MINILDFMTDSLWRKGYKLLALNDFPMCFRLPVMNLCETALKSNP